MDFESDLDLLGQMAKQRLKSEKTRGRWKNVFMVQLRSVAPWDPNKVQQTSSFKTRNPNLQRLDSLPVFLSYGKECLTLDHECLLCSGNLVVLQPVMSDMHWLISFCNLRCADLGWVHVVGTPCPFLRFASWGTCVKTMSTWPSFHLHAMWTVQCSAQRQTRQMTPSGITLSNIASPWAAIFSRRTVSEVWNSFYRCFQHISISGKLPAYSCIFLPTLTPPHCSHLWINSRCPRAKHSKTLLIVSMFLKEWWCYICYQACLGGFVEIQWAKHICTSFVCAEADLCRLRSLFILSALPLQWI